MSAQAVYEIATGYGLDIGLVIAPHDLRRTFARLARAASAPIEHIQYSLGHASLPTTERTSDSNRTCGRTVVRGFAFSLHWPDLQ